VLHQTNNFPEFTGRVCPAPCEAACTLNVNDDRWASRASSTPSSTGPGPKAGCGRGRRTGSDGRKVAVVGSGPAGLAAAQQLARAGHGVTVFEKNSRIGGLLRYGIPDFKMEKSHIDRRVEQMQAEGVVFRTGVQVGRWPQDCRVTNDAQATVDAAELLAGFDAVLLAGGAELSRDLPVPGRELDGVHFAMEFLPMQNKVVAGDKLARQIRAEGKHVVVIGGGDTGSDCVGTSNRHGAASVTQFELMPQPPVQEDRPLTWPYWPIKLRTSSSHEEGCKREFAIATKAFLPGTGRHKSRVAALQTVQVEWQGGRMTEVPGSEREFKADLLRHPHRDRPRQLRLRRAPH
jgi:glutamate synthase (NADPH/NADH) small chain